MRTRTLVAVAILLGGLLAAIVVTGLDRLGHLEDWDVPGWKFENQLLKVKSGTYVIVRSLNPDAVQLRFMFERTVTEPTVDRDRAPKAGDPPVMPYIVLWMQTRQPEESVWRFTNLSYAALAQMGARTTREWLEEIGPVRERRPDGSEKILLRARFGQENGSTVVYFFDPDEADPSERGFGWTRMEAYGGDDKTEISVTTPDGRYKR